MTIEIKKRILVVDDEKDLSEILCEALFDAGYNAQFALNGKDAVDIFLENSDDIDLVVLDMRLPDISGLEILSQMMVIKPAVKGIFLSGYLEESEILKMKEKGITKYFLKPYALNTFISAVNELLLH